MPATLALPIDVRIERLGVAELDWRVGTNRGTIRGLAFGYTGGATGHRVSDLTFVAPLGAITGNATIDAAAPFAIGGRLHAKGDAALTGTEADIVLGGSLAALTLDATGKAGSAPFTGRASVAPLAATALREVTLDARRIDLAAWNSALPTTELAIVVRATPAAGAIAGTIDATNAATGTIDAGRVPLSTFSSRFAWRDDVLSLESIAAALEGGGAIAGNAQIPVGAAGSAGSWTLELRDIDLRRIYAPLLATRLSGKLAAELDREQQRFRGDIADRTMRGGIALDFAAVLADGAVVVDRFRARSGKGELVGRGRIALGRGARFRDRSDRHAIRSGGVRSLSERRARRADRGQRHARGAVARSRGPGAGARQPPFGRRHGRHARAAPSRGAPSATSRSISPPAGRRSRRRAAAGATGDRIAVTLDSPELADFAPLLPAPLASSLGGALSSQGRLRRACRRRPASLSKPRASG